MRAVAARHERSAELVPVDRTRNLHEPTRAEKTNRPGHDDISPAALTRRFSQPCAKSLDHRRSNLPQSKRVTSPETCTTDPSGWTSTRTGSTPASSSRIAPVRVLAPTANPYLRNCLMTSFCLSGGSGIAQHGLRLEHHKPLARPERDRFGAASGVQFREDRPNVELHRVLRNVESRRDRLIREALSHHAQHLEFARRQRLAVAFAQREPTSGHERVGHL